MLKTQMRQTPDIGVSATSMDRVASTLSCHRKAEPLNERHCRIIDLDFMSVLTCLRGALPPVDLRAVCLVLAMMLFCFD
eukprot:scaffold14557_cov67-Attheya_sp.AAC.10